MKLVLPPCHVVLMEIVPAKSDFQDKNVIAFQAIIYLDLIVLVRLSYTENLFNELFCKDFQI